MQYLDFGWSLRIYFEVALAPIAKYLDPISLPQPPSYVLPSGLGNYLVPKNLKLELSYGHDGVILNNV